VRKRDKRSEARQKPGSWDKIQLLEDCEQAEMCGDETKRKITSCGLAANGSTESEAYMLCVSSDISKIGSLSITPSSSTSTSRPIPHIICQHGGQAANKEVTN
jgi:hypothetical protein